jgi:hypothetical protein
MGGDRSSGREGLAAGEIYGTVVYLAVVVLLEEDRATALEAIDILLATGIVFWLAHVYAHLVPQLAAAGRLTFDPFLKTASQQLGVLVVVVIPVAPLALAAIGVLPLATSYTVAEGAGLAALGAFAIRQARGAGLSWMRSVGIAVFLLAAGVVLVILELSLH